MDFQFHFQFTVCIQLQQRRDTEALLDDDEEGRAVPGAENLPEKIPAGTFQ